MDRAILVLNAGSIRVIPTDEERVIARHAYRIACTENRD